MESVIMSQDSSSLYKAGAGTTWS